MVQYGNNVDNEQSSEQQGNNIEILLDLIADALIQSPFVNISDVEGAQKTIRNGIIQTEKTLEDRLVLYQRDLKANQEDLVNSTTIGDGEASTQENLQQIANGLYANGTINTVGVEIEEGEGDTVSISLNGGGEYDGLPITDLIISDGEFSNTSQFIPIKKEQSVVNPDQANEFLDTNIYELLPTGDSRQSRITRFFQELNALLPTNEPNFDIDGSGGTPDGRVDRIPGSDIWTGADEYSQDNSISYAQDNQDGNIDEEDAFLHRLSNTANDTNSTKTIEDIYKRIEPYLTDILEDEISPEDGRPEYNNQSDGYLQFRNLNQGIIIRNTNSKFIDGLDPSNLTYLDNINGGGILTNGTGFTITMWVRFLDKSSEGTLFNFGNPIRGMEGTNYEEPGSTAFGFKLETYVLNKNDDCPHHNYETWEAAADAINQTYFTNSNSARFVRLVVNDNGILRDSHTGLATAKKVTGIPFSDYKPLGEITDPPTTRSARGADSINFRLLQTTHIPENFNEWYFICATFNPAVNEDVSINVGTDDSQKSRNFWLNHIVHPMTSPPQYTENSGYGNKSKVQIISRTDLLRARGFKVD